jgi:hypothetical protein
VGSTRCSRGCRTTRPKTEFPAAVVREQTFRVVAGSQDFSIVEGGDGDTTVVNVMGEIDMGTGPAFQRGLRHAIGAGRSGLIVDLSDARPENDEGRTDSPAFAPSRGL